MEIIFRGKELSESDPQQKQEEKQQIQYQF